MSIQKKFLKSKPICKVTFRLDQELAADAQEAYLVGEFNNWETSATPMQKLKNGSFKATVDLEQNKSYQFRYLIGNDAWQNDDAADRYVPSGVSFEENSVVEL